MGVGHSKVLGPNDIRDRLTVPQSWMDILRKEFKNGEKEATIKALCFGYAWAFRCSIRMGGRYEKPVFQAPEWQRFKNYVGIKEGDRIIPQVEENYWREIDYNIRVQRKDADGVWADLQPPAHVAPLHQFI